MSPRPPDAPYLGVGVGLRPCHYPEVLSRAPAGALRVDWFEAISENYMGDGGRPRRVLGEVRSRVPVVLHGVSLDIGSSDPLNGDYLAALAALIERVEPAWVSDHLCWTGVGGTQLHDLLPLPRTEEVVLHVARRIERVQEHLGRRIAIENVSSYVGYADDALPEWEFLSEIAREADCGILLDVNNVFVSAHNHGFDPGHYIDAIPCDRVFQIHLAGHSQQGPLLIDTHDHPIRAEVWSLYERAVRRIGPVSTLIEWDDAIPGYDELEREAMRARAILARIETETRSTDGRTDEAAGRDPAAPLETHPGA